MALLFSSTLLLLGVTAMAAVDDRCVMKDSCHFKLEPKTCSCHPDCHLYGTCCLGVDKGLANHSGPAYRCYGKRTREALFVRASCKPGYRGYSQEGATCIDDDEDEEDVVSNLLVTNRLTKVTYWNKQCARCNEEDMSQLEFWDVAVRCNAAKGVTKKLISQILFYDWEKRRWGGMIGELFIGCVIHYLPPSFLYQIKRCNRNLVDACPPGYPDQDTARKCLQTYAERKLKNGDVYFRNVHCAHCNGVDERDVECSGMWTGPEPYSADESDLWDYTEVVFSGGDWVHREPGRKFECSPGYAYDPFRGRCRTYRTEWGGDVTVILNSAPVSSRVSLFLLTTLSLMVLLL